MNVTDDRQTDGREFTFAKKEMLVKSMRKYSLSK